MHKNIDKSKTDWSRPYYENLQSPSEEKLTPEFHQVEYQHVASWKNMVRDGKMIAVEEPDGSHLYLPSDMSERDQTYVSAQFWNRRWSRWIEASQYWALGIFGPPIALFVLGWALLWVGRGFKKAPARE